MKLSKVHSIHPSALDTKMDSNLINMNARKKVDEYEALKDSISSIGQLDPILMRDGLIVDGRHRISVCKELDIEVKYVKVTDISEKDLAIMINTASYTARELTAAQKALHVKAHINNGFTQTAAMRKVGFKDKTAMAAINFLLDNKSYSVHVNNLRDGNNVEIKENQDEQYSKVLYRGKSLRKIHEVLLSIEATTTIRPETPVIDWTNVLNSELARSEFFKWLDMSDTDKKLTYAGVLNHIYPDKHMEEVKVQEERDKLEEYEQMKVTLLTK